MTPGTDGGLHDFGEVIMVSKLLARLKKFL